MTYYGNIVALAAVAALAMPAISSAQPGDTLRIAQAAPKSKQSPRFDPQYDIEELTPSQIQRAQEPDRPASPNPAPSAPMSMPSAAIPPTTAPKTAAPKASSQPPQPQRVVSCSGAFAKKSNHIALTIAYKLDNVTFTQVDATDSRKIMASVLFPKDPKRRLEVWWENEESRSGTYLIVIGGQSTWLAPKGLKLGLALAALERLNGKPFKVNAFSKGNEASVSDWQGGALEQLTGGCKMGVSLRADSKATPQAIEQAGAAELASTDAALKAIKPVVAEIIVGY